MAVNESRSMHRDLSMGMTDGKYKKRAGSTEARGGVVEPTTAVARRHLFDTWYGTETEATGKVAPDMTFAP